MTASTPDEARWLGLVGWNLRCQSCGGYGASWMPLHAGKSLALCSEHTTAVDEELIRHQEAMRELTEERFRQPSPPPKMPKSRAEDARRRKLWEEMAVVCPHRDCPYEKAPAAVDCGEHEEWMS